VRRADQLLSGLVKQVSVDGNEIANHSWSHPNLYKNKAMRGAPMASEVQKTNKLIEKLVMIKPAYFRAPYNMQARDDKKPSMTWTGLCRLDFQRA